MIVPHKRAALYVRVSTDEQAQKGTSLGTQEDNLRSYCERERMEIADVYRDDGYSGGTLDRPELQRMLADARAKRFDLVLTTKTDRLSRSIPQVVRLVLEDLEKLGIGYRSITEPFDTVSPAGRMFFVQLASFADFERASIRERSKAGKQKAAVLGKMMHAVRPWGYTRDSQGFWAFHQDEAKLYHEMVRMILEKESTRTIALKFNVRGTLARYGGKWKAGTVHGILTNPIYKGTGRYSAEVFKVPPLVSVARWDRVQEVLTANQKKTLRKRCSHFSLLRGLVRCGRCGRNYYAVAKSASHGSNYRCASTRPDPEPRYCGSPYIRQARLDGIVWSHVSRLVKDGDFLREQIRSNQAQAAGSVVGEATLIGLDGAIRRKQGELDKVLSLYTTSRVLTVADLDREAGRVKGEIAGLQAERAIIEKTVRAHETARRAVADIETMLARARHEIDKFDQAERRQFLQKFLRGVVVSFTPAGGLSVSIQMAFKMIDVNEKEGGKQARTLVNVTDVALTSVAEG